MQAVQYPIQTYMKHPLGQVRLHKDVAKLRLQKELFHFIPISDKNEHSLEVVLPFLQTYLKKFELVPIVAGSGDYNKIAEAIDPLLNDKTLLVASSDLSHFLQYDEAVRMDKETINAILNLKKEKLIMRGNSACGSMPILIVMRLADNMDGNHFSFTIQTAAIHPATVPGSSDILQSLFMENPLWKMKKYQTG